MDESKQIMFTVFMGALVLMSFIGGCSYALVQSDSNQIIEKCIAAGASWQDGNCVR